jgi:hypothetical protein
MLEKQHRDQPVAEKKLTSRQRAVASRAGPAARGAGGQALSPIPSPERIA